MERNESPVIDGAHTDSLMDDYIFPHSEVVREWQQWKKESKEEGEHWAKKTGKKASQSRTRRFSLDIAIRMVCKEEGAGANNCKRESDGSFLP